MLPQGHIGHVALQAGHHLYSALFLMFEWNLDNTLTIIVFHQMHPFV